MKALRLSFWGGPSRQVRPRHVAFDDNVIDVGLGQVGQGHVDGAVAGVVGEGVDHHFGDGHGHRFGQGHRSGADAVLLQVLDAFGPDPFDHVFDDVVGEFHRLEDEDEIVLGEIPALTPDGEQLLETVEGDTNRCRPQ